MIRFGIWDLAEGHASKNVGGQINSPLRTLVFGRFFTDTTAAQGFGLAPCSYARTSPMCDALHAALFNPYYVIQNPAIWLYLNVYNVFHFYLDYFWTIFDNF